MKFLSFLSMLLLPAAAFAQLHVSTEPQPRVAVLEEFTGIRCVNCPDGHYISSLIKNAQPELFIPINFHAGGYASPRPGQPDYRTEFGESLNSYMGVRSYPIGTVNRSSYNGTKIYDPENWRTVVRQIATQTSPVNLWAQARFDASSRQLTVDVETYFTSAVTENLNLNIYLLQTGIKGPQEGGNMGDEYIHRHMFRACITPDWGAVVSGGQPGESRTETYTYTVPEAIKNVPVVPEQMEVVVTINRGRDEIITATECYPTCPTFADTPAVTLSNVFNGSAAFYGYTFLDFKVTSDMIAPITSLTFKTNDGLDATATKEVTVECDIPRGATRVVEVPFEGFTPGTGRNRLTAQLVKINGEDFDGPTAVSSFVRPEAYPAELTFVINTDRCAADNRFILRNSAGEVVKEFGPYTDGSPMEYREQVSLPTDKEESYCLEIHDSWADGMLSPSGSVEIFDAEGNSLARNIKIDGTGARMFFRVARSEEQKPDAIENVEAHELLHYDAAAHAIVADEPVELTVYAADGHIVATSTDLSHLHPGVYVIVAQTADGVRHTLKVAL